MPALAFDDLIPGTASPALTFDDLIPPDAERSSALIGTDGTQSGAAVSFDDLIPQQAPIPDAHPDTNTFLAMSDAQLRRNVERIKADPVLTDAQKAAGVAHFQEAHDRILSASGFDPELRKQGQVQQGEAALAGALHAGTGIATGSVAADAGLAVLGAAGVSNPYVLGGAALLSGGLGFFGGESLSKKALADSARDGDPVLGPLGVAAQKYPDTAASGELAAVLAPGPGSIGKLAEAANLVAAERGTAAAAKFVARQMAAGAAAGVGTDALIRETGKIFGMPDSDLSPQSSAFAGTLGALLSGHGVKFRDYSSPEVADIMRRGMADETAARATPDGGVVPGTGLKPEEQKVYMAVRDQLAAIALTKPGGAVFDPAKAEFTARQVGGAGGNATVAESAVPVSFEDLIPGSAEHSSALIGTDQIQPGAPTTVLGTKGSEFPAVYAFAPTSQIETSHAGEMLAANPNYQLTNTRDYSDPAERDKQLDVLANFDPRRHVTDAPDASVGPSMVGTVIDENGHASLQRFGGNSRGYAIANLSPERRAGLRALENAKAGQFGLVPNPDPDAELVRHLGTFDFRQPGERARAQAMVDALNPSPGRQQSTAERAQIDAQTLPLDGLAQVPMEIAPKDAQAFVTALIAHGHIDRNLSSGIAASPAQAQDYTQRLLVNAAFRQPAIAEARRDPRAAGSTVRGLIDAAVPALLQLRAKGGAPIADAITQAFTTTLGYVREDGGGLADALDKAAGQMELSPEHEAARAVATAMQRALVLDKGGKPQPEQTSANARTLFANLAHAVAQHQPGTDLFGQSENLVDVVKRATNPRVAGAQHEAGVLPREHIVERPALRTLSDKDFDVQRLSIERQLDAAEKQMDDWAIGDDGRYFLDPAFTQPVPAQTMQDLRHLQSLYVSNQIEKLRRDTKDVAPFDLWQELKDELAHADRDPALAEKQQPETFLRIKTLLENFRDAGFTQADLAKDALEMLGSRIFSPDYKEVNSGRFSDAGQYARYIFGEKSPATPSSGPMLRDSTIELGSPAPEVGRAGAAPAPLPMALEGRGTVSIPQVLESFAQIVQAIGGNAPIRFGRFFKRALGIYKVQPRVIRIGNAGDLATAAHEVSHALQHVAFGDYTSAALVRGTPAAVSFELRRLGTALYGPKMPAAGYESEGLAEFLRLYLTEDSAKTNAPATFDWFTQDFLAKQPPALRAAIVQAKALADTWRSQGALARAQAQMPLPPGRLAQLAARTRSVFSEENWIERFKPLKELADEYERETGKTLRPSMNPYEVASARRGTSGAVTLQMVLHGMIDLQGNLALDASGRPIGSLREILAPLRGLESETAIYLHARRAIELGIPSAAFPQGRDGGMDLNDARHLVQKLEAAHPDLAPAAERIYEWQNAVLEYLREANPALSESIDRIQASSENYVPLARYVEQRGWQGAVQRFAANALARLKGSGRQVKPIFDQIITNTQKLVAMAHKSQVLQTMVRLAQTPGLGHIIEEVPKDRVKQSLNFDAIRKQLEDLGVDTSAIGPDQALDFYTVAETPKGADPIVPVRLGSEVKWFQVSPELFELLNGLEPARLGPLADLFLGVPARNFRLGTTGLRASFNYITNPTRDLQTLMMQTQGSDNPARVLAAYLAALREVAVSGLGGVAGRAPSPFVALFGRLGIEAGQPFGIDVNHTRVAAKGLFQSGFRQLATSPLSYFRALLNFMESVPRIAELRLVAQKIGYVPGTPMTPDQATALALAAKRVTTDFSAGGKLAQMFNQAIPFFNANVQGARTAGRTFKQRPWAMALKILAYPVALTLALWWKNKDKPAYRNMPWRERYTYWNYLTEDGNVIQIPKTQEWGQAGVMTEAIIDAWYNREPRALTEAVAHTIATLNPLDWPVILRMLKEQWLNRIEYFDQPIVPRNQVELPPGEQFAPYTSELAKALGRAFPDTLSPRRIDAAVRSTLGGAGGDALALGDRLVQTLALTPLTDRRAAEASDLPILGRVFRRGGASSAQSQALADFWDVYTGLEARAKSKTFPLQPTEALYFHYLDQRASGQSGNVHGPGPKDQIKTLETIANATQDLASRQSLYRDMAEVARKAIASRPKQ